MVATFEPGIDAPSTRWRPGPVTSRRLWATRFVYVAMLILGLIPILINAPAGWQAAGVGLWLPGGGFLAVGGWAVLLFPLTGALFLLAVFAWFGSGMIVAPPAVWVGSVIAAGGLAGGAIWQPGMLATAAFVILVAAVGWRQNRQKLRSGLETARQRVSILPQALRDVRARAAPKPADNTRVLDDDELASARYLIDRALQPIDTFAGFDRIDQFQTAALRYQINMMSYALSTLQQLYTPNFHGYLSLAQRNLIAKYLEPAVWRYWVYESMWGHLNFTDWNPAGLDNIMLTGYFGRQALLYMGNTGDVRYTETGSLTFRLNDRHSWAHDVHSISRSVYDNIKRSAFCLYPCEPNWIYPGCNFYGMTTLVAYDRVFGTDLVASIRDNWLANLDREFTNPAGSVIGLRSSITGIELPFPVSDLAYCTLMNCFAPERAERMWAVVQVGLRRLLAEDSGLPILQFPDKGIDFGNYRRGNRSAAMSGIMAAAHEFGDEELAAAARNTLNLRCHRVTRDGATHYRGSNMVNAMIANALFIRRNDGRDVLAKGPPDSARTGPLLAEAPYPEVLVARATSAGEDLDLVLKPGRSNGIQRIGLDRLAPGRRYSVEGRPDLAFRAGADGRASVDVLLEGRTRVHIVPAA